MRGAEARRSVVGDLGEHFRISIELVLAALARVERRLEHMHDLCEAWRRDGAWVRVGVGVWRTTVRVTTVRVTTVRVRTGVRVILGGHRATVRSRGTNCNAERSVCCGGELASEKPPTRSVSSS